MAEPVIAVVGDSGAGKTTALNKLFNLAWKVGESSRAVTTSKQEAVRDDCLVIDYPGGDTRVIAPYLESHRKAVILVFVTGRYLDRYDHWKEGLQGYDHLLLCVRAHDVKKQGVETTSISVEELLQKGVHWLKSQVKEVGSASKKKSTTSSSTKKSSAVPPANKGKAGVKDANSTILTIQVTSRQKKHFDLAWKSISSIEKKEIEELRAHGDALLLLILQLKTSKTEIYKQNDALCKFLSTKFPMVKDRLTECLGKEANDESIGNGLETIFAWSMMDKSKPSAKHKRTIGCFLLQEYILWVNTR